MYMRRLTGGMENSIKLVWPHASRYDEGTCNK